ncbi:MAG: hypothetical protein KDK48_05490, partial [Chlamydiia bacterium]|nr:hypothetical protein [Chlamydiia bacterium]
FFNAQSFACHLSFENQLKIADLLPDFWKRFRRFSRAAPHEGLRILMTRSRVNAEEFSSLPSMLKMLYFAQLNPDEAELLKEAMLAFIEKMRSFSAKKWHALWNATLEGSAAELLSSASSVEDWQGRILKTSYREQEKLTQTYLETKEAPPLGLLLRGLDPKTSAERRRLRTFLRFMLEAHPRIVFFLNPLLEKIDAKTEGSSLCQLAGVIRRKEMQCFAEDIVSMVSLGAELEALERISLLTFGYSWFTDAETLLEAVEKRALHPETIARERRHLFLFLDNWLKFRLRQEPTKRVHRVMRHMSRFVPFQGDIELCKAVMRFKSSWTMWQSILRAGQLSSSSCRSNEIIEDVEGLMAEYLEGTEKEKAVKLIAQDMKGNAQEMLRQIPLEEFHKELWSKGTLQGEGFQHMVSEWNLITQRTKLILLKEGYTPVQRARLIELFIEVAHKLITSRDYYSAYALYGVFHASEIVRLKESWADVGMEFKAQLAEFDGLFALDNNYQALRTRLAADRESGKGFIPPLNLLTKDLTFTLEKQDRLFGVVNTNKLFLICRFLRDFNSCQVMNGTNEVRLRTNFTASMHTLTASDLEVDLWAMSLKREPKKRPAKQAQN